MRFLGGFFLAGSGMVRLNEGGRMIRVTRLNHAPLVLNSDLIEHLEMTPDTVISLTSGQKYVVMESADEVVERVVTFRRRLYTDLPRHEPPGDRT